MRIRILYLFVCFFIAVCITAYAAEQAEITLKDGSVIRGEILSKDASGYLIKSRDLGTLKIDDNKIKSIHMPSDVKREEGLDQTKKLEDMKNAVMGNKEVMGMISALQNDPEIQEVLKDPAVLQALMAGDIATLMANPKIAGLANNPAMQEILKKIK